MAIFEIEGGHKLNGEITPQGAKNEALQILCAVLLTDEEVIIDNIPDIIDIRNLIGLLDEMGVEVNRLSEIKYSFKAKEIDFEFFNTDTFLKKATSIRGSIMIIGPLLARFGKAFMAKPGGDKIGRRRLDTHFNGLKKLGATLNFEKYSSTFSLETKGLHGDYILLEEASVTGTANVLMAAVLAIGETTIFNAACEPYIQQLCKMLICMGAKIDGVGSNLLKITGVGKLTGCTHKILPDMIEIGSFIGLAAMTGSSITIKNVSYENLGVIPDTFRRLGINVVRKGDDIYIPEHHSYEIDSYIDGSIMTIADAIWPGLTPDLLSIILVVATQAKGEVLIHQKMFESRLFFVDKLIDMGAKIILCDPHRATVIGLNKEIQLNGTKMSSPDIRAGVALLIAALSASGKSYIHNIDQIDRGYFKIDERLKALGAKIRRI